jgi:hypothetical protein
MLIRSGGASREDEQTNTGTVWPTITGHTAGPGIRGHHLHRPGSLTMTFYPALNER